MHGQKNIKLCHKKFVCCLLRPQYETESMKGAFLHTNIGNV